ncbi:MAG: TetR/AcrR family transcriptional regulator [Ignavibacteriales bacterium]|nr:TetR/AcrR family transcriptional regulator [Ignavibacteriales bacterium]
MARLTTEERQKTIIDEALNIIHERGYEALSIRELANRVKISEPAIYRHFLNKEDIILGILSRISDFDQELIKSVNKKDSPLEKLNEFIKFHFSFLEKNKQMTSVIFAEEIFTQSNILKEKLLKILKHRKMLIVDIIESAKSDNKIKEVDSTELSKIIIGTIRMSVLEWKLGNFSYSLIESGNKIIKNLEKLIFN